MKVNLSTICLLLLVVVLVSSVLGILCITTAYADLQTAQRQCRYFEGMQACVNKANRWLAENGEELAALPEGSMTHRTFTDGEGHFLKVMIETGCGEWKIRTWKNYTEWSDNKVMDNLVSFEQGD